MVVKTMVSLKIRANRDGTLHATLSFTADGPLGFHYEREHTAAANLADIVTWVAGILA